MQQLSFAEAAGQAGMAQADAAAERRCPDYRVTAEGVMLAFLAAAPERCAAGEDLVDAARRALPQIGGRAFGNVIRSMSVRGLIRCVRSDLPRRNGHGTSGGKLWALCQ
jgi:hypothetical protein